MNNFKKFRKTADLNQQKTADLFGVHRQTYCQWETGKREPSAAALRLLGILEKIYSIKNADKRQDIIEKVL